MTRSIVTRGLMRNSEKKTLTLWHHCLVIIIYWTLLLVANANFHIRNISVYWATFTQCVSATIACPTAPIVKGLPTVLRFERYSYRLFFTIWQFSDYAIVNKLYGWADPHSGFLEWSRHWAEVLQILGPCWAYVYCPLWDTVHSRFMWFQSVGINRTHSCRQGT